MLINYLLITLDVVVGVIFAQTQLKNGNNILNFFAKDKFDILKEVQQHDKSLYSAHIMSLVIISNYTLDQLDKLV